jgi:hypothetical protein
MNTASEMAKDKLLRSLVEQLKLPILHIARQAELNSKTNTNNYEAISNIADMALGLIDSYILSIEGNESNRLNLEPVTISSVLQSAAYNLDNMAKMYNCDIELHVDGRFRPVMSDRRRLEAVFTMLGYSFIEAQAPNAKKSKGSIFLSTYKTKNGLSAGIFSPNLELNGNMLDRSPLDGKTARQSIPELTQGSGAGFLVAESILKSMSNRLRIARFHKLSGLATTLIPSQQLELVV